MDEIKIKFDKKAKAIEINGTKYEIRDAIIEEDDMWELLPVKEGERDKLVDELTEKISKGIMEVQEPKDFLKHVVRESLKKEANMELRELSERMSKEKASVKPVKHCYAIMIGGKRGAPYQLNIAGE